MSTIEPAEIARFSAIAAEWWDPRGKFSPLHRLNPARLAFVRDTILRELRLEGTGVTPLAGLTLADIGCGGGLTAEPLAKMGAAVTAVDASAEAIGVARTHAALTDTTVDYRVCEAAALVAEGRQFDVVTALEVIEHVSDTTQFMADLAALVRPGGVLILSTLNRTARAFGVAIIGAEYVLRWLPRGTHSWRKFVKPSELAALMRASGLKPTDVAGLVPDFFTTEFRTDPRDLGVNYLMVARKTGPASDQTHETTADFDANYTAEDTAETAATATPLTAQSFRVELLAQLRVAERMGQTMVDINAGQLHRELGGYPGPNHRLPVCCEVMHGEVGLGDAVIDSPPKGKGASLTIRYQLPRRR
jgi:2-polyprenyl-6-hydroxyphenyl methylase / 3-demethylubiquinone-9 3-methyltransferase